MAPKTMKRPAAQTAGGKRPRKDPIESKCDAVGKALCEATDIPESTRLMLSSMLFTSLGLAKEERHQFQTEVVKMVDVTLQGVGAALEKDIEAAEAKLSEATNESTSLAASCSAASDTLAAKKEVVDEKKKALADAVEAQKVAKKALTDAVATQKAGDAELDAAAGKKEKLEAAQAESYGPLKEGSVEKGEQKKVLAAFSTVCKEVGIENSLITSAGACLSKEPGARGDFDAMVLGQLDASFSKALADLTESIANGEPAKAERASAIETAQTSCTSSEEQIANCTTAISEAQAEQKAAEVALKDAEKAVKKFSASLAKSQEDLDAAKEGLEEFRKTPLAAFQELEARTLARPAEEETLETEAAAPE